MTSVEVRILQKYDGLSRSEKKIADYFLQHADSVFHLSIGELAKNSDVSQAAWVRFSKSLGYSGLKELKKALYEDASATESKLDIQSFSDLRDYTDTASLALALKNSSTRAIEEAFQLLEPSALEEAARRIMEARAVRLFGMGASGRVAADFGGKLLRINLPAVFGPDLHTQLVSATNAGPNEVAVFISRSGNTREMLEMHAVAKEMGAFTLSLTHLKPNPLAHRTHLQLYTRSPNVHFHSGAMSSRLAQLFVTDVLYATLISRGGEAVEKRLQKVHDRFRGRRAPESAGKN